MKKMKKRDRDKEGDRQRDRRRQSTHVRVCAWFNDFCKYWAPSRDLAKAEFFPKRSQCLTLIIR